MNRNFRLILWCTLNVWFYFRRTSCHATLGRRKQQSCFTPIWETNSFTLNPNYTHRWTFQTVLWRLNNRLDLKLQCKSLYSLLSKETYVTYGCIHSVWSAGHTHDRAFNSEDPTETLTTWGTCISSEIQPEIFINLSSVHVHWSL